MPVEEVSVHSKVRKTKQEAGCYDRQKNPVDPVPARTAYGEVYFPAPSICRQIGRRSNGGWVPLAECLGCKAEKDHMYINQARIDIDRESNKFMKADQRL